MINHDLIMFCCINILFTIAPLNMADENNTIK